MSAESERSEANPSINADLNNTLHLNSWDEYNAHVCMHCEQASGHSEIDRLFVNKPFQMDRANEMLRNGVSSGCLESMLILKCLEWATLKLGCWDDVKYLYYRDIFTLHAFRDWQPILFFDNPQFEKKYIEVNIGNNSHDPLPRSTGSLKTLSQIKKWLEECTECGDEHRSCRSTEGNNIDHNAQVRFLDIRNNAIRLIDAHITTIHACLSHCWGPPERMIKTTKYNIEEHRHGITLDLLPKTFQDAIQVCRHVGIDYIWIDSLCIIQDDDDDWKFQASQMSTIYERAVLTIAASKASNPHDGLFTTRSDACLGGILPGLSGVLIRMVIPIAPCLTDVDSPFPPERNEWPLYYRGWCFQELILSPRIISFGPHEVIWECISTRYRETFPKSPLSIRERKIFTEVKAEVYAWVWHNYLTSYTRRSLTYPKDRLPAIAAIARKFQNLNPNRRYLAGLWTDTLLYDLLWASRSPETKRHTSNELQIPSWSWASLTGEVEWPTTTIPREMETCVEDVRTKYTIDGPEFTGHIREASITLTASVIPLDEIIPPNIGNLEEEMKNKSRDFLVKCIGKTVSPDYNGFRQLFRQLFSEYPYGILQYSMAWDTAGDKKEYDHGRNPASSLWVVPLMETIEQQHLVFCLLVKRGVEAGTYVRVGYVQLLRKQGYDLLYTGLGGDQDLIQQWEVYTKSEEGYSAILRAIDEAIERYIEDVWCVIKETKKREIVLV